MSDFIIDGYAMTKNNDYLLDEYNYFSDDEDEETCVYVIDEYVGERAIIMPPDYYNSESTVTIEKGHILITKPETEYMIWLKRCLRGNKWFLEDSDKANRQFTGDSQYDYLCMVLKRQEDGFRVLINEIEDNCYTNNILLDYEVIKRLFNTIYERQNVDFISKLYESHKQIGDIIYEAIVSDDVETIIEFENECGFPGIKDFDKSPDPFIRNIMKECRRFHSDKIIEYYQNY